MMNMHDDFYKSKLSVQGMYIYDAIEEQIIKYKNEVFVINIMVPEQALDDGIEAYRALRNDKPQYYFLSRKVHAKLRGNTLIVITKNIYTLDQIKRIDKILEDALQRLTGNIENLEAWEREKSIYGRIAQSFRYSNQGEEYEHNVVGLLVFKQGLCESFSSMLVLALRKSGIPAIKVFGYGMKEKHCWCMAWINGIPYHLDVTWDIVSAGQRVRYYYFNLLDEEIRKDHIIFTQGLPKCNDSRYAHIMKRGISFGKKNYCKIYNDTVLCSSKIPIYRRRY